MQQRFIEALGRLGVVERACHEVDMSVSSAYALRQSAGGEGFARAWAAVLTRAADRLLDIAFEQGIEGEEVPIFDQDGVRTGSKRRYNTRMAMFLLRAYHPDRFAPDRADPKHVARSRNAPALPVPTIVASLAPVTPAEPHRLATPERLEQMNYTAQALTNFEQNNPRSDRETYRHPRREEQHAKVRTRARVKRARRERLFDEVAEREGFDPDGNRIDRAST